MVNEQHIEQSTNWESQKAKLRRKFTVLRDHDLDYMEVQKAEMVSKLVAKLGLSEARLQAIMEQQ